jgi:hypothetical protein
MSLLGGDLTTPQRVATWMANAPSIPSPIISQLIGSMTNLIYSKLNRARLYSQTFTRTFDGVGTAQIMLPDYPVTSIQAVQQGSALIPPSVLPNANGTYNAGVNPGYGYRFIPWSGNLPGDTAMVELNGGFFWPAPQNVQITYTAGYLIQNEQQSVPTTGPYTITVNQFQGIWCRDNGVTYAATGAALTPVTTITAAGQYIVGPDSTPGLYTFSVADEGQALLISYSFIPADLEEAVNQMVVERYAYRTRVGEISKSLGGQETVRFARGSMGPPWGKTSSLPPEVMDLINPYISVLPPTIGAPV